jgi:hypothetical protein
MGQVIQQVLSQAWSQFSVQCLTVLPNLIASLLFLALGLALTWLAGRLARALLRRSSVERRANRIGLTAWLERAGIFSVTALAARFVQAVFAVVTAGLMLYALDAALASDLTRRFFLYLPNLAVGIGIFLAGMVAARFVERRVLIGAVNRGLRPARLLSAFTRSGILVLATAVALDHVGIGGSLVPSVLLILIGGATLAAALAVGLGSRRAVSRWIDDRRAEPEDIERDELSHW